MTPAERAEVDLTAGMLRAAARTDMISAGLTLLSAGALAFGYGPAAVSVAGVALGIAGRYFGFRVGVDRQLFDDLAEDRLTVEHLDAALRAATGGRKGSAPRSISDRCRGARRLVALHAGTTVAQAVAAVVAGLLS